MSAPENARPTAPLVEDCAAGRYAWCSCGRSAKLPHCDGSHRGSEARPVIVELAEPQRVAWCRCGRTGTQPYCDGSHRAGSGRA